MERHPRGWRSFSLVDGLSTVSERSDTQWTSDLLASPHEAPDKSARVRSMFNSIAPRYQLVNRLFSGGRDAYWRRKAVALCDATAADDALDIACGTGDFADAFIRAGVRKMVGGDFAHEMLVRAAQSDEGGRRGLRAFCECDALSLPFRDGSFSIASCAFGVRNFQDLDCGLREMHRVLRPGGRAVILEFTRPRNVLFRGMYEVYANRVMPLFATMVSGDRSGAYRYLPRSVVSFASAEEMCQRLRDAGFAAVSMTPLTLGVVTVYVARRDLND
jgi:demethylmenaquinone methyltransferase/2-methoxy-6-polyprenyl-1,4-benzoquinol methylase